MAFAGIITEYNPFHNGHLYHLKRSREFASGEGVVALMNGNFTQRGSPACLDKWQRARMAIRSGVDLVLELPLPAGVRSAHFFAQSSVKTLEATGMVDTIVFGSESGRIRPLKNIAKILAEEPAELQNILQEEIKKGISYPRARARAVDRYLQNNSKKHPFKSKTETLKSPADILSSPNNILGIEYIKNIYREDLNLTPHTIKRKEADYHAGHAGETNIASATSIRKIIYKDNLENAAKYMPSSSMKILRENFKKGKFPPDIEGFKKIIDADLRTKTEAELEECPALSREIVKTLTRKLQQGLSYDDLIAEITSKTHTTARIKRGLLHTLLRLNDFNCGELNNALPNYIRVLAVKENRGEKILGKLSKNARVPVCVNPSSILSNIKISGASKAEAQISLEIMATDIYSLLYPEASMRKKGLDFRTPLIKE